MSLNKILNEFGGAATTSCSMASYETPAKVYKKKKLIKKINTKYNKEKELKND